MSILSLSIAERKVLLDFFVQARKAGIIRYQDGTMGFTLAPAERATPPALKKGKDEPDEANQLERACGHDVGSYSGGVCLTCIEQGRPPPGYVEPKDG